MNIKNKKGFTLIEILVVVGVILVIVTSISGVMSGVFNSQGKNKAIDKISQNGEFVLSELKKNILNANSGTENGVGFSCPMDETGNSITITNIKDGNKLTISCLNSGSGGYKIASISAIGTTVYLFQKNNDLILNGCNDFVTCSTLPSLQLSEVKFNFVLGTGVTNLSSGTTKYFSLDVNLRN